jgi:deoxyribonuclease V
MINKKFFGKVQDRLALRIDVPGDRPGYTPQKGDLIFALDAHYAEDRAYIAIEAFRWQGERVRTFVGTSPVRVPYVSRFFCFREGPVLLPVLKAAQQRLGQKPALCILDGHGIAHPRRLGLASWVGIHTDTPTLGCAKRPLLKPGADIEKNRGNYGYIEHSGQIVGAALVTREHVKPVFVSPGHKVDTDAAMDIILSLSPTYRLAEPLRRAHRYSRAHAEKRLFWDAISLD